MPEESGKNQRTFLTMSAGAARQGRRPHPQFPFTTIRSYLSCLLPALASWASRVTSLREVTSQDIHATLDAQPPVTARNLLSALHACSGPSSERN
jgi:hypothetical protein